MLGALLNRSGACQAVIGHRRILDVVEPLLGENCHVIANTAWRNPTGVIPCRHPSARRPPADRLTNAALPWRGHEPVVLAASAGNVEVFVSDVWHRRLPTAAGDAG
ncbi:MAG: hypothetical protein ACKV2O_17855 [Acidimicrobiales bacterium]